jgi:hypothetical protein
VSTVTGPRTEQLVEAAEGARVLDPVAERLAGFWSRKLSAQWLRDLLSGRQLGHPLHPAAVLPSGEPGPASPSSLGPGSGNTWQRNERREKSW